MGLAIARAVMKKASKIFSRFGSEIGSPSLASVILTAASSATAISRMVVALWRIALSVRCDSTISALDRWRQGGEQDEAGEPDLFSVEARKIRNHDGTAERDRKDDRG